MLQVFKYIIFLASLLFSMGTVFAIEMPFSDIQPSDSYYDAVRELYEGRVISDNGDHLFKPHDLMSRDFFVSLAVGIGCHKCETPNIEDIIKYQISPFVDLPKTNQYYYCIAYAKDNNITQGYILDNNGQVTCENRQQYMSSPFCAANTITRIEAAAILLRRAKLWDDTINSTSFDKSTIIPDTTSYWYGYAKKWIDMGIIAQKADGKIGQDEKISRGEFAIMAARILRYTQCQVVGSENTVAIEIVIRNSNWVIVPATVFKQGSSEVLSLITGSGVWDKKWTLTNPITKQVLTGSGDTYPIKNLSCGTWINTIDLIDRTSHQVVSSASNTINIDCSPSSGTQALSVSISADPIIANIGMPINFIPLVHGGSGTLTYHWDYGDGSTNTSSSPTNHIYENNGNHTVTLTVTDALGNVARSSLVVIIQGERDTDWDKIPDSIDQCPLVYAISATGCPTIPVYNSQNPTTPAIIRDTWTTIEAAIGIRNGDGQLTPQNSFPKWAIFSLIPITGNGSWNYSWHATNPFTGQVLTGSGFILPGSIFGAGDWKVTLDVINPRSGEIIASPSITIRIQDNTTPSIGSTPCVSITANPISTTVNSAILLTPTVCTSQNPLVYTWNYGDGSTSNGTGTTNHTYTAPGVYTITLTVTDPKTWITGTSVVIVKIVENDTTPIWSTNANFIGSNICLENHRKTQWLLIGKPNCTQCPCNNVISITAPLRSCDIVFPTILSPSLDMIYARGWFYLIP